MKVPHERSQPAIVSPEVPDFEDFRDADAAVERLNELYRTASKFLCNAFSQAAEGGIPSARARAFYPEIRLTTTSHEVGDSRLSFGHVAGPGTYSTTVTRPDLFASYLKQQIALVMENHDVPVRIGPSTTPMPVHFAVANDASVTVPQSGVMEYSLRDYFDVPDLSTTHDEIVNGYGFAHTDGAQALAPFPAQRVDYSLARLAHYTATAPDHFQNHVLFTNYQFYVDEFEAFARSVIEDPDSCVYQFCWPE